ncbi:hypothetical protein BHF71_10635 [Vulcanibacillus modesticaldus]|uniref:Yip1 domain-containing protein n=1 Tax=Vulcanibacillus modesticaldus TaxID=337097 RepID=A0A1D2YTC1_9BACI|nr:Yip1 family protein [Vulcanibacillus modesticaldus]OEF98944.1 hypothetical protein BHF71_10635 [Vulcanibacillus modesticaldus]
MSLESSNNSASQYRLLLEVWTKPKKTIRYIVDTDPKKYVLILAVLSGIYSIFGSFEEENIGDNLSLLSISLISIVLGAIVGIITLYLFTWIYKLTGKWIGGKADYRELRAAYAWGSVPIVIVGSALIILKLIFFGKDIYTSEMLKIGSSTFLSLLYVIFGIIELTAYIWTFVISLKVLGEVQGFSTWRALGNLLLTILVVFVAVFIIVLVGMILFSNVAGYY